MGKQTKIGLDSMVATMKNTQTAISNWKRAVSLSFTVYDHGAEAAKRISPRYSSLSTAKNFKFKDGNDYNNNMLKYCQHFTWRFPAYQDWYTEPKAKNLDKKISVYWSVSVGAYHHWTVGGPKAFYNKPRLFNNNAKFGNFK